jgi:tetratricopeptide (TPR) repeat protein
MRIIRKDRMGVPREDLLLMTRALKRGYCDVKSIRRALERQISKPITFLEALHLSPGEGEALRSDLAMPDPVQDSPVLDSLRVMLLEGEHLEASDWEKFIASLTRPTQRHGYPPLQIPQEFEGFTLQWELSRRERGVVYRAKDRGGREIAIKVFRKDVPVQGELPRVEGHAFTVSDFVDGVSLESRRPSGRRAVEVIERAAQLLRDRPHGALTPARIVVRRDDSVSILGFEYARTVPLSNRAMAYGGKGDVHALGAILYEILVGSPPAGATSPAARNREVDEKLDLIVSCALSGGYGSTGALADDLGRYLNGEPITGRRAAQTLAAKRQSGVWRVAAVAAAILGAILILYLTRSKHAVPPEESPKTARLEPPPKPLQEVGRATPAPPRVERPKALPPAKPLTPDEEQRLYAACVQAGADTERVITLANQAIDRGSKADWPYFHLANAYTSRDELDKALEYVSRAMELAPDNTLYLELRAQIYAFRGEARRAAADFEHLYGKKTSELNKQILRLQGEIQADAKDARARLLRGVFYYLKKHYEPSEKDFTAAIEMGQRQALVWRALAWIGLEDRARAVQDAKAYREAMPTGFALQEVNAILKDLGAN